MKTPKQERDEILQKVSEVVVPYLVLMAFITIVIVLCKPLLWMFWIIKSIF